jgi:hypothetical protein
MIFIFIPPILIFPEHQRERKQRKRISEINDGHRRRDIEKIVKIYKQQQVYKGDKIHRDKCKAFVLHFDDGQLFGQRSGNF